MLIVVFAALTLVLDPIRILALLDHKNTCHF